MPMITYPLNNIDYNAEDAELYNATRTSGVWSGDDFPYYVTGNNNFVSVGEGLAWIRNSKFSGKVVAHRETEDFDFGVPDPSYPRIDVLAIRYDAIANSTVLAVKKGVPSATPEIPERSVLENLYELYLFSVYRPVGSISIKESDITDLRDDERYCGYMQDAITEGYAPSLVEQNKKKNFRFWVGTENEYKAQKDNLKENTFCITTDDVVADSFVSAEKIVFPYAKSLDDFIYFVGISYDSNEKIRHSVVMNIVQRKEDGEVIACGQDFSMDDSFLRFDYVLKLKDSIVGYVPETKYIVVDIKSVTKKESSTNFDEIIGVRANY